MRVHENMISKITKLKVHMFQTITCFACFLLNTEVGIKEYLGSHKRNSLRRLNDHIICLCSKAFVWKLIEI